LEIDIETERLFLLKDIARMNLFAAPTSYRSIYRYARTGVSNHSGATVYLECVNTPTGYATSREACRRFIRNLNA
jgi:hypothetical protein